MYRLIRSGSHATEGRSHSGRIRRARMGKTVEESQDQRIALTKPNRAYKARYEAVVLHVRSMGHVRRIKASIFKAKSTG